MLQTILEKIDKITPRDKNISILAVTKNRMVSDIVPLLDQGITMIGENKIQEANTKFLELGDRIVEKHLIGPLQSNKENKALELFDVIQSIESLEQLKRLVNKINTQGLNKKVFLQYNTALEDSKHGLRDDKELFAMIELLLQNPNIHFEGLMTIGALSNEESLVRKSFSDLRSLRDCAILQYPELTSLKLSMGMSNDFEWAIQEGADIIRLGTVLFK